MQRTLIQTQRGKIYLGLQFAAGACLILAPFLPWSYYALYLTGGINSQVTVFITGLGSIFSSPAVSGVPFSFPMLQNWSYGVLAQVIGILTILASVLVFYRAEDGGLIAFILGFINIAPSLFFIGRSAEIQNIVEAFVIALQNTGYSLVSFSYVFAIGFVIDLIGTILLPVSSILITSNATRLRTGKDKKKAELPEERQRPEQ
jgi:hypothetical protein